MKKFLIQIMLFLLITLCLAMWIDDILSIRLRESHIRMFAGWNVIYNDTINYDLVVLGNSRAWRQYNPMILDSILNLNTYNFGIDGSCINRQIIKYNKYCSTHTSPKYLIQNIDCFTFGLTYGYEREQFFPYLYDKELLKAIDKYENFSFAEKWIPCYRYFGYKELLIDGVFNDSNEPLTKGYKGYNCKWDGSELAKMDSITCACDTSALRLFIDFAEQETLKGTKILFVYAPIYYVAREKMVNEKQMFEMYDSIAKKFDIPILDYNDYYLSYDTMYFYNATHLNRQGAELFTTKLAHDIDSIGFLK